MRYGAVERSPVSVQFINANDIRANQATSERLRVVIITVALIVRLQNEPLSADRLDSLALTEIRQLQNQLTAASTGLAQFWIR